MSFIGKRAVRTDNRCIEYLVTKKSVELVVYRWYQTGCHSMTITLPHFQFLWAILGLWFLVLVCASYTQQFFMRSKNNDLELDTRTKNHGFKATSLIITKSDYDSKNLII